MSHSFVMETPNGNALDGSRDNITDNLDDIFTDILGMHICDCSKKTGKELLPVFLSAIDKLQNNVEKYKKMQPANGWRNIYDVMETLSIYIEWFRKEPDMFFGVY